MFIVVRVVRGVVVAVVARVWVLRVRRAVGVRGRVRRVRQRRVAGRVALPARGVRRHAVPAVLPVVAAVHGSRARQSARPTWPSSPRRAPPHHSNLTSTTLRMHHEPPLSIPQQFQSQSRKSSTRRDRGGNRARVRRWLAKRGRSSLPATARDPWSGGGGARAAREGRRPLAGGSAQRGARRTPTEGALESIRRRRHRPPPPAARCRRPPPPAACRLPRRYLPAPVLRANFVFPDGILYLEPW